MDTLLIQWELILTNLFSKITSQNGTIKLFTRQTIKSLVNVQDVVGCMKFVGKRFHKK